MKEISSFCFVFAFKTCSFFVDGVVEIFFSFFFSRLKILTFFSITNSHLCSVVPRFCFIAKEGNRVINPLDVQQISSGWNTGFAGYPPSGYRVFHTGFRRSRSGIISTSRPHCPFPIGEQSIIIYGRLTPDVQL